MHFDAKFCALVFWNGHGPSADGSDMSTSRLRPWLADDAAENIERFMRELKEQP
jgi:hypothetical protein